jgi:CDP-4-dehydro-6-deoxyglucose reductase, E1
MKWPLNKNNFTFLDRLKICKFILNPKNRWTQDIEVKKFEKKMADYVGCKYAVFVGNGSLANNLLAQYVKSTCGDKKIVVLPSTTWQTSCSPWIKAGFTPHFIDVSLEDFSINKDKLRQYVIENKNKIACVFPTSLIGFTPDMAFYKNLEETYKVKIMFDNCENTLSNYFDKNISSYFTSSTSTYFGHQIQSIEGGFIFTNSQEEYKYFLMNRNHGMVRSLTAYGIDTKDIANKKVDSLFDFYSLGDNYRNTDLNAFIGQLDFARIDEYTNSRKKIYNIFKNNIDTDKYYLPADIANCFDVPFCIPIIVKNKNKNRIKKALELCKNLKIEYRPVVSGYLGYQTCYKEYFKSNKDYPNSLYLHDYAIYIGLYDGIKIKSVLKLTKELNKI